MEDTQILQEKHFFAEAESYETAYIWLFLTNKKGNFLCLNLMCPLSYSSLLLAPIDLIGSNKH